MAAANAAAAALDALWKKPFWDSVPLDNARLDRATAAPPSKLLTHPRRVQTLGHPTDQGTFTRLAVRTPLLVAGYWNIVTGT